MQNKSLSLLNVLIACAICGTASFTVAQEAPTAPAKTAQVEQNVDPKAGLNEEQQKAKEQLEKELTDVNSQNKMVVDFPNRSSLGEMELAPLPGIKETLLTGPAPMEPSLSKKDLPSEQLLGRITPEVFQEMADLERGNTFLQLQKQREQLKADLERLKASYRQERLKEITERENVVRTRIGWWQEQEKIRLEIEKKKAEAEAVEQQIEEAEAMRNKLRAEAAQKAKENPEDIKTVINIDSTKTSQIFSDLYSLVDIKGAKGALKARLKDLSDSSIVTVQVKDVLPSGHVIQNITKDSIFVVFGDQENSLTFKGSKILSTPKTENKEK